MKSPCIRIWSKVLRMTPRKLRREKLHMAQILTQKRSQRASWYVTEIVVGYCWLLFIIFTKFYLLLLKERTKNILFSLAFFLAYYLVWYGIFKVRLTTSGWCNTFNCLHLNPKRLRRIYCVQAATSACPYQCTGYGVIFSVGACRRLNCFLINPNFTNMPSIRSRSSVFFIKLLNWDGLLRQFCRDMGFVLGVKQWLCITIWCGMWTMGLISPWVTRIMFPKLA